jgi:hypothetical protein
LSAAVPPADDDLEDGVFNKAGVSYEARQVAPSWLRLTAAWIGNLITIGGRVELFAPEDRVVIVDRRTARVVLKRGGLEVPAAETLREVSTDLSNLSIRQFRAKWGIPD